MNRHRSLALATLLLCTWVARGASDPAEEKARELLEDGSYRAAAEALVPLVEKSETARLLLAELHRRTGAYEKGIELLAGRAGEAALRYAELLLAAGRLDEAERRLRSIEDSAEALWLRGVVHARRGEPDKARAAWQATIPFYQAMTAAEAEKAPPELFVIFGRALAGLNRFEEANEIMLAQALEKDDQNVAVLLFAGELFFTKYDFPEGRRYFRKALTVSSRHPDAQAWLARATLEDPMLGGGRLERARTLAQRTLEVNPRHERALLTLGDTYFFDGRYENALGHYREARAADRASLEALGAMYACAHATFRPDDAEQVEKQAHAISRNPAPFYVAAAKRCEVQNQYPTALDLGAKAYAADPSYWPLYTNLALGELRAGRYARARKFVEEGFRRDAYNVWLANTRTLLDHLDSQYVAERWNKVVFHAPRKTAAYYVTYLGPLLMQAYELFEQRYGVTPPDTVHVEVYPKQQYFATRTLGLPDFPAQGVCFGTVIAVTVPPAFAGNHGLAAWHEFAHVFTVTGSDYRIPRWLTEGISVREEGLCPVGGTRSYRGALGQAVASGDIPSFSDFDRRFRRPRSPAELLTAYALSPLAVEFLIERFGPGVIPRLLRRLKDARFPEAFAAATQSSLADFDAAFQERLRALGSTAASQFAGAGVDTGALGAAVKAGTASAREQADLAWAYLAEGREIDAETLALKLKAHEEFAAESSAILGLIAQRNGRFTKAEPLLKAAVEGSTRNAFRVLGALAAMADRRKDAAGLERALETMWKRFPELSAERGDGGPLGRLCRIWAERGDPRLKQGLEDLVAYNRETAWARATLAEILEQEDNTKELFTVLSQLAYLAPFERGGRLNVELFTRLASCAETLDLPVEAARAKKVLAAFGGAKE
jgi:tetratricopeptide (TPR) repeat protein